MTLTRSITTPLGQAVRVAQTVAAAAAAELQDQSQELARAVSVVRLAGQSASQRGLALLQ